MRYLIAIVATFGLIVLVLVLLFRGGGSDSVTPKGLVLSEYASSSSSAAHFILDGPVVANENHDEIKIDVTADQVVFTLYNGYEGDVIKQQTYPNNRAAYTVFLKSLQQEGFTKGNSDKALQDERGVCPLGQRRIYSFDDGNKTLMRFWSTSCGNKTYGGSIAAVNTLFRQQVPNYSALLEDTDFDAL